jgi:ATP-binding cassette subfamily F protein uup
MNLLDGIIEQYAGGYDDYLLQKQDTLNKTGKTKTKTKQTKKIDAPPKKKLTYKQQQELTTLPEKIEKAEVEIGEIQLKLSDPEFFQRDESQDALIRLSRLEADLERYYDKWSALE